MDEIEDVRLLSEFKGITFSKFKKTDVRKELFKSLVQSKIEMACYWCAELVCACHYDDIWEIVTTFYTKHVHFGNIKMAPYLDLRMTQFKIIANNYIDNPLVMRNNPKIRILFCEIICALCYCKQRHSFDVIKITKDDFDVVVLREKFKAPTNQYAEPIFLEEDPKELFPAINEFAYNISEGKNIMFSCFWFEWMMEFENICKLKKEKIQCERRNFVKNVYVKYQKDVIWLIWDVLQTEAKIRSKFVDKIMASLLSLFCFSYSTGCHKKKRYLLYFAISLLCETTIDTNEEIIQPVHQNELANILENVHLFYRQIKKNEEKPNMDYLYQGMKNTSFENTLSKLQQMDSMSESFIPRIS